MTHLEDRLFAFKERTHEAEKEEFVQLEEQLADAYCKEERRNKIWHLEDENGHMCTSTDAIGARAQRFFEDLFTNSIPHNPIEALEGVAKKISPETADMLTKPVYEEDIQRVVFAVNLGAAPAGVVHLGLGRVSLIIERFLKKDPAFRILIAKNRNPHLLWFRQLMLDSRIGNLQAIEENISPVIVLKYNKPKLRKEVNKFSGYIPTRAPIMFTQVSILPIFSSMKLLPRSMNTSVKKEFGNPFAVFNVPQNSESSYGNSYMMV
ncbi:hypothetical protein PIB30_046077 [Stylosanthes scabra]|uniref:Uncharacterized protein n=1 Tax=Stylosanthes scabra TaxID=79078 RepID=A0ABU6UFN7_9FABA|nr:hypothetical protein [Stylosanthes scabra]